MLYERAQRADSTMLYERAQRADSTMLYERAQRADNPKDSSDNVLVCYPDGWFTLERESITLPSALSPREIDCQSLQPIVMIEAELQKGQVTDALEGLHLALREKSLCF
jgi:hypothetical protein